MPLRCPHCEGIIRPLPVLSSVSLLELFQCDACSRVSERPRGTTENPLPIVLNRPSSAVRILGK